MHTWSKINKHDIKRSQDVYIIQISNLQKSDHLKTNQSNVGFLTGVIDEWYYNIQSTIATEATDTETKIAYHFIKKACTLLLFLASGQFGTLMKNADNDVISRTTYYLHKSSKSTQQSVDCGFNLNRNVLIGLVRTYIRS